MKTLRQVRLKRGDRNAIREASRVLSERFPVERIILYGSKARGTDDAESDIDLLALTSRELAWQERRALTDVLFDVQLEHDVVISVLSSRARNGKKAFAACFPSMTRSNARACRRDQE